MDRQAPKEGGIDFVDTLKQLLSRVKNGSITVTKQDGHVMQIAFSEKSPTLRACAIVGTETDKDISANDLKLLLEYLDRVTFGTVTVQIRNASITEVEKIEKIKI
jgi:hypothetical protein